MISIVYLLGAGRSGTTLLATVLNTIEGIRTIGEMHQFPEYARHNKDCSCGKPLRSCPFWGRIISDLDLSVEEMEQLLDIASREEQHRNIPALLLGKKPKPAYAEFQGRIFDSCQKASGTMHLLDSSKYIARFLLLNRIPALKVTGIYLVRDVRGVVESFGKNVQTPKNPLQALLYYGLINMVGELVYRLYGNVIKVRYEDFIADPLKEARRIVRHIYGGEPPPQELPETFEMPHIVGGNRMKAMKTVSINKQDGWHNRLSRLKRHLYYLAAFPLMILNHYKP